MIKIRRATHAGAYRIEIEFSTGERGTLDLEELVSRDGAMVQPLRDAKYFSKFFLELGALSWPNGFDLSPGAVYRALRDKGLLRTDAA